MKGTVVTALMVGGALAAGSAAAYLAKDYIDQTVDERRAELDAQYQPVRVVVASSDLRAGALLSNQTVAVREVPRAFLHAEAVRADHWDDLAGRVLAHDVKGGEPVLRSHLAQNLGAGFSAQLAEGMRALTFPVDEESSLAGMLSPGDRIDIFFTTTSGSETVTVPLLTNVPVIATGIRTIANGAYVAEKQPLGSFRTITVSVTPEDAARVTLAQDAGKITTTLRTPQDEAPIQVARVTKSALLNGKRIGRSSPLRARVEVILGNL